MLHYQASLSGSSPSNSLSGRDQGSNNSASSTPVHERSPSRAPHPASSAAARARIAATNYTGKSRAARLVLEAQESLRASSLPPLRSTVLPANESADDGFGDNNSAFGEDSSAFGDKEEDSGPRQSSRAVLGGNGNDGKRTEIGATRGLQQAASANNHARVLNHSSSSEQMEVRRHPRYREFYHMRWKLNVEAHVVAQQMAQIGLDPEVRFLWSFKFCS